ncbi:MAG: ornithine carbamoyltransferase, partial [Henriciella sp.]
MAKHFIDLWQVDAGDMRMILDQAHAMKRARIGWPKAKRDADVPLDGHILAMLFEKSSTRTRFSFDVAMRQLGGETIVASSGEMQLGRGETVEDTARVLSRFV